MTTATNIRAAAGRVLRQTREEQELSQEQLSFRAGLHRTYISSAERGQRNVSVEALDRWLAALGMSWQGFGTAIDGERARRRGR